MNAKMWIREVRWLEEWKASFKEHDFSELIEKTRRKEDEFEEYVKSKKTK
jgi:hypothetical protein